MVEYIKEGNLLERVVSETASWKTGMNRLRCCRKHVAAFVPLSAVQLWTDKILGKAQSHCRPLSGAQSLINRFCKPNVQLLFRRF
jgi:hypothetical protein